MLKFPAEGLEGTFQLHRTGLNLSPSGVASSYDPSLGLPGLIVPDGRNQHYSVTAVAGLANDSRGARFQAPRTMTIGSIAFEVTTADAANPACDVGIYEYGGVAGSYNLLASSGSTTGKLNATGVQVVALTAPYTLQAGRVYFAAIALGSASAAIRVASFGGASATLLFSSGAVTGHALTFYKGANLPLANVTGAGGTTNGMILGLREAV